MKNDYSNIDEYITQFSGGIREKLEAIRKIVAESAPNATEAISYGMPTFKLNGNLIHFAAFKDHIGVFPTGSSLGELEKEAAKYRTGKGTLQFSYNSEIPYNLIKKIVELRVSQQNNR